MDTIRRARHGARHALDLVAGAAAPRAWRRHTRDLLVLMYHRVLPASDPRYAAEQPGMVVTPQTFHLHLDVLSAAFRIVRLGDWIDDRLPAHGPYCAITFDDGWHDNHEHAWPLLRAAAVPATVFLVSDLIGTGHDFWPGRLRHALQAVHAADAWQSAEATWLADLVAGAGGDPHAVERVIVAAKRMPDGEIDAHLCGLERRLGLGTGTPTPPPLMGWDQVREMQASGLVDFGAHTRHHVRLLESVAPATLRDEIEGSAERIHERLGVRPRVFCYPNGDRSPAAERIVRATYAAAVTTRRGWNHRGDDPHGMTRVGVHEDIAGSRLRFRARLAPA